MVNLRQAAAQAARRNGIPVDVFLRLVGVESGWRPRIVSSAGAIGLTQLMPGTARGLGVDPWDPVANLEGGARYLKGMLDRFGNLRLALAAYNAGAGAVEKYNGIPPYPETQHYVSMILGGLKQGAQTMRVLNAPGTPQPPQVADPTFKQFGPDLGAVGMKNLSEGADPFRSLQNLTAEVAYSQNMGVPGMPTTTPIQGGGMPPSIAGGGNASIARNAMRYVGTPYVWGGSSPSGFDCSGLLQYAAAKAGIHIGRTTYQQYQQGHPVGPNQLQPGDAVFFRGSDSRGGLPGHVGIYIGHGMMIDAPHTGARVRVERVSSFGGYMGARRY